MMDFIERLEACAERRLDEMTEGLPVGKFRCCCGKIADLDDAMPATPDPYSSPICQECVEQIIKESQK